MVLHLMQSFILAFVPAISLFFKIDMVTRIAAQAGGLEKQATVAGFGLVGIPVILVALWGVRTKNDVPIRLYGYYLLLCFVVDLVAFLGEFFMYSPCGTPGTASFACGASRILNSGSVGLMLGISIYLTFIVFSYAEEVSMGAGPDLSDLLANAGMRRKQPLVGSEVMTTSVNNAEMYGTMTSDVIVNGPTPIFGGGYHETNFPPGWAATGTYRQ